MVVFDNFFAKCKFVYVRKAWKKFRPFSECFKPQNSPLLSGEVIFPELTVGPQFGQNNYLSVPCLLHLHLIIAGCQLVSQNCGAALNFGKSLPFHNEALNQQQICSIYWVGMDHCLLVLIFGEKSQFSASATYICGLRFLKNRPNMTMARHLHKENIAAYRGSPPPTR